MIRPQKSRELTQLFILIFSLAAIAVLYLAKTVVVPLALAILFSFEAAERVSLRNPSANPDRKIDAVVTEARV